MIINTVRCVPLRSSGMDTGAGGGGINRQAPAGFFLRIDLRLQFGFDLCQDARALPGLE